MGEIKKAIKKQMKFRNEKKQKRAETTIIEPTESATAIKHPRE